jgi:hypothetical protein
MTRLLLLLAITLLLACACTQARAATIFLRVEPGAEVCVGEDVAKGGMLIGEYNVEPVPPNQQALLSVFVYDTVGNTPFTKTTGTDGQFAVPATTSFGEYRTCISNPRHEQVKMVRLSLKTTDKKAMSDTKLTKVDHLKPMERELKRLEEQVSVVWWRRQ